MIKPKTLAFTLLITAAMTLPLKAAEQCCQPCPNGVLVGVTADSCGFCADLATLIQGCAETSNGKCTSCIAGFHLTNGACIPCTITIPGCLTCSNGATCNSCGAGFTLESGLCKVTGGSGGTIETKTCDTPNGYIPFANCTACASGGNGQYSNRYQRGCATCVNGTTRVGKDTSVVDPSSCFQYCEDHYGCRTECPNSHYYTTYHCE